jgi:hypothetical protein
MSKLLRLVVSVLCFGVLALGVFLIDFVGQLASPHREDPDTGVSLAEELARTERLKLLRDASYRRVEDKWQGAQEVIAGQRSLAEAIEQFRDLDRQWPDIRTGIQKPEDLWMSEDEWDGRAVIEQVRQVLADRPDEATAVVGRLEKELRQLLAERNQCHPAPADPKTEPSR